MGRLKNSAPGKSEKKACRCALPPPLLSIIFAALALAFTWPAIKNMEQWGIHDWGEFYTLAGSADVSITRFHQFPLWNPYMGGGNPLLAHPHSACLSPFFLPVLFLGVVKGLKVTMLLFLITGMGSMYWLLRHYGNTPWSCLLFSLLWGCNGWVAANFAVGHVDTFAIMLLPAAFLFFLKAGEKTGYRVASAAVLTLTLFSGGIYPFIFAVCLIAVYSVVTSLTQKSMIPVYSAFWVFLLTAALSSVKLLPMAEFLETARPVPVDHTGIGPAFLWKAFGAQDFRLQADFRNGYGSWEYYAYIGFIPLLLCVFGAVRNAKKDIGLLVTAVLFLVVSLGTASPLNFFSWLQLLPGMKSFHVPFRFIIVTLFCLIPLGAKAVSEIEAWIPTKRSSRSGTMLYGLLIVISAVSILDVLWINSRLFSTIFVAEPVAIEPVPHFTQTTIDWERERSEEPSYLVEEPYSVNTYKNFLANKGSINAYDPLYLHPAALPDSDQRYRGEVFLHGASGAVHLLLSSPNRVELSLSADTTGIVVLNQNWHPGWQVSLDKTITPATCWNGLVAAEVSPEIHRLTFFYLPRTFLWGLAVTLFGIGISVVLLFGSRYVHGSERRE